MSQGDRTGTKRCLHQYSIFHRLHDILNILLGGGTEGGFGADSGSSSGSEDINICYMYNIYKDKLSRVFR